MTASTGSGGRSAADGEADGAADDGAGEDAAAGGAAADDAAADAGAADADDAVLVDGAAEPQALATSATATARPEMDLFITVRPLLLTACATRRRASTCWPRAGRDAPPPVRSPSAAPRVC